MAASRATKSYFESFRFYYSTIFPFLAHCASLVTTSTADIVASSAPLSSHQTSAITDLERQASLRGITVLRGQVTPKQRPQGFGDEHVESYL